jgi:hypothetical protein
VPVFRTEHGKDLIDLYFIENSGKSVEREGPFKLLTTDKDKSAADTIDPAEATTDTGIKPETNHVVGTIRRSEISGDDDATVAVFPTRPSGLAFLKENNAWGFVRARREFEYVAMYVSQGPREIKYIAKPRAIVPPEKADLQRSPLEYTDGSEIDDGKMVVQFEPNSLYELADPVPFKTRAPQSLEYTTLGLLKRASTTDDML